MLLRNHATFEDLLGVETDIKAIGERGLTLFRPLQNALVG